MQMQQLAKVPKNAKLEFYQTFIEESKHSKIFKKFDIRPKMLLYVDHRL